MISRCGAIRNDRTRLTGLLLFIFSLPENFLAFLFGLKTAFFVFHAGIFTYQTLTLFLRATTNGTLSPDI